MVATRDQMNAVRRMFERMRMRIFNLVSRATVSTSTTGARGATVGIKALQGDDRDGAEYFEPYGIAGAVPVGSEGVALAIGGSNDQVIVVCASNKGGTPAGRLPGEVDIYSQHGQRIRLHADGSISLLQGSAGTVYLGTDVNPAAPAANRNGDLVSGSTELLTWITNVTAVLNVVPGTIAPLAGTTVGSTVASQSTTKVGG